MVSHARPAKAVLTTHNANGTTHQIDDDGANDFPGDLLASVFIGVSHELHTTCSAKEHSDEDLFDDKQDRSSSSSSSGSSSSEEADPDAVDPEDLRADWAPIRAISKDLFHRVLLQHLLDHGASAEDVTDENEIQGGFNFVRIMELAKGPCAARYVIKVPCTGTSQRWQEADAYMLRCEAQTMQ
jgi:hypothetical protein